MTTYRFNKKFIEDFAVEEDAIERSLAFDDFVQATIERRGLTGWEILVETYDGNGAWESR